MQEYEYYLNDLPPNKHWFSVCGCQGTISCDCGFSYSFCFIPKKLKICPYCGNETKTEMSYLHYLFEREQEKDK